MLLMVCLQLKCHLNIIIYLKKNNTILIIIKMECLQSAQIVKYIREFKGKKKVGRAIQ